MCVAKINTIGTVKLLLCLNKLWDVSSSTFYNLGSLRVVCQELTVHESLQPP